MTSGYNGGDSIGSCLMKPLTLLLLLLISAGPRAQDLLIGSRLGEAYRQGLLQHIAPHSRGGTIRLLPRLDQLAMLTCQDTARLLQQDPAEASFALEAQITHVLALRQLQLPDQPQAGAQLARHIQAGCQHNPQQLLLGVVDLSLRQQQSPTPPYADRTTPPPEGKTSVGGIPVY